MREGITVIVPTIGRASLTDTLASFADDLTTVDAVVVMNDGKNLDTQKTVERFANLFPLPDWIYQYEGIPLGDWGHPLRNIALDLFVETSHIWTLDDDDVAAPGALDALRSSCDVASLWRVMFTSGTTAWVGSSTEPSIAPRNCAEAANEKRIAKNPTRVDRVRCGIRRGP